MRIRTIFLIVAIALLALFAFLNVDEFMRPSLVSLGFTTVEVPLALLMLGLLVVAVLVFLATTMYIQSQNLLETRKYARELQAQRELADKAEASRFTELQRYIESQNIAAADRMTATQAALSEKMAQNQALLLARLEQAEGSNAAYIGELEDRLERRDGVNVSASQNRISDLDVYGRRTDVPLGSVQPVEVVEPRHVVRDIDGKPLV